jgi:hypothetical protein
MNLRDVGFWLAKEASYFSLKYWYPNWSKLYQFLFQSKYNDYQITRYKKYDDLVNVIQSTVWQPDGPKELFDAFSSPHYVQYLIDTSQDKKIGDCDEYALYLSNAIQDSKQLPLIGHEVITYVLSVVWMNDKGITSGHSVCLLQWVLSDSDCLYSYMDYNHPIGNYTEPIDLVKHIVLSYGKEDSKLLAYAVYDNNLNVVHVERGT